MAILDFSGALVSYDAFSTAFIDHAAQAGFGPGFYSWTTFSGYTVTALSTVNNITATGAGPTGGTIGTINVVAGANPIFSVTGLNVPLTSLLTVGNPALTQEKFWETVLAGATTVIMPQQPGIPAGLFGDFLTVNAGQNIAGAADVFLGNGSPNFHTLSGDAFEVDVGGFLTGGNDQFVNVVGNLFGDLGLGINVGSVKGGNDSFSASGNPIVPTMAVGLAIGDVYQNAHNVTGGADTFNFTNLAAAQYIVGDVYSQVAGFTNGGGDTINIARTDAFFFATAVNYVVGDVYSTASGAVKGGNDVMTLRDIQASAITGDVLSANGNVTGGADTITFASSAPFFAGPPALMPAPPAASILAGDVVAQSTGVFVGGNDTITVTNAFGGSLAGDAYNLSGTTHGTGGKDVITINWNQVNITPPNFTASGDFATVSGGGFTGNADTIVLNLTLGIDAGATLSGDGFSFSGASFYAGHDTITVNSNRFGGNNFLYGDAQSVNSTGTFHGGNDVLTGSNQADFIFGDAQSITAVVSIGGNDVLNGRGGNDTLDGGLGSDTAVYSSLNQAVYVNLNGIPGSAPLAADWFEAIGQGSDQLIGIERIIGSSLNDVIIGDANANVFDGLNGNDTLRGEAGQDFLRGGLGNDTLTGGIGVDYFVFNTAPNYTTNRDFLTDFVHGGDKFWMENSVFTQLGAAGALNGAFFRLGPTALDANDYLVYNNLTGNLYYDSNGNGAGGAILFATLTTKPILSAGDFVVI
jgi:Ca2+-binding RTX toxin-like protein